MAATPEAAVSDVTAGWSEASVIPCTEAAVAACLDSFQIGLALTTAVWNCLKLVHFILHDGRLSNIENKGITTEATLIVCSCNVLSDDDVRSAVSASADLPRTARQLYGCLGCSAECGRCARTINRIIRDALGACARECAAGCPHVAQHGEAASPASLQIAPVSAA
jgi:bacterioferritin-associated ferredoxin